MLLRVLVHAADKFDPDHALSRPEVPVDDLETFLVYQLLGRLSHDGIEDVPTTTKHRRMSFHRVRKLLVVGPVLDRLHVLVRQSNLTQVGLCRRVAPVVESSEPLANSQTNLETLSSY